MSASNIPTLIPCCLNANAILIEVVDLPTPPLPDAIATTYFAGFKSLLEVFSGDEGFSLLDELQDKDVVWKEP